MLDSLVSVPNSSPGQPEPFEGNLVAAAGSCGGLMVKHPWPLLEISLSDFRRLATLNMTTYLPTCHDPGESNHSKMLHGRQDLKMSMALSPISVPCQCPLSMVMVWGDGQWTRLIPNFSCFGPLGNLSLITTTRTGEVRGTYVMSLYH